MVSFKKQNLENELSKVADHQVYIILAIAVIINMISVILSGSLQIFLFTVLFFTPTVIIPFIIRKGFSKILSNSHAIIYTIIAVIIVYAIAGRLSLLSILVAICPYYILTNKPIITSSKVKKLRQQIANIQED